MMTKVAATARAASPAEDDEDNTPADDFEEPENEGSDDLSDETGIDLTDASELDAEQRAGRRRVRSRDERAGLTPPAVLRVATLEARTLFHFSDDSDIDRFDPRPVRTPAPRRPGYGTGSTARWSGRLPKTISSCTSFPVECPRIVMSAHAGTSASDRQAWFGDAPPGTSAIAYIEARWMERLAQAVLTRYELPSEHFVDIDDAGMWVSRDAVVPREVVRLCDLRAALAACRTELRAVDSLVPLKPVWQSSMHASGIRLRNAADWA